MRSYVERAGSLVLVLGLFSQMAAGQSYMVQTAGGLASFSSTEVAIQAENSIKTFEINERTRICVGQKDANSEWQDLRNVEVVTVTADLGSNVALSIRDGAFEYALGADGMVPVDKGCRPWTDSEFKRRAEEPYVGLSAGELREVQQLLAKLEYDAGPIDGVAGPKTRGAVRAFEEDSGMEITGVPDRELVRRLREAVAEE